MRTIEAIECEPLLDHCGVVGLMSSRPLELFRTGLAGLEALQTRGQDGAGFCALTDNGSIISYKSTGMIRNVFTQEVKDTYSKTLAQVFGYQTRYGTNGAFHPENTQPFSARHEISGESFFVAHNGEFSAKPGDTDTETSDTAKFVKALAQTQGDTWESRIGEALSHEHGAWSLIIGTRNALYLSRDPRGIRPLSFGFYADVQSQTTVWAAASETSALEAMRIRTYYDVKPGETIRIDSGGVHSLTESPLPRNGIIYAACSFEGIYIEENSSVLHQPRNTREQINVPTVQEFRRTCGRILATEAPISPDDVDFAIGIPGTGIDGGEAYAQALSIPYIQAITDRLPQNDPRTFMTADIDTILQEVLKHFNFDTDVLREKRVVLIDDSIVRGNIMTGLVRLLKEQYGVRSVHIRVLSPMIDDACFLGVNTRTREQLIAYRQQDDPERIRNIFGVDTLTYLSTDGLKQAFGDTQNGYCYGCMVGHHPPVDRTGNTI